MPVLEFFDPDIVPGRHSARPIPDRFSNDDRHGSTRQFWVDCRAGFERNFDYL
jgi:hypothetical protein